jgi:hypothetical protein
MLLLIAPPDPRQQSDAALPRRLRLKRVAAPICALCCAMLCAMRATALRVRAMRAAAAAYVYYAMPRMSAVRRHELFAMFGARRVTSCRYCRLMRASAAQQRCECWRVIAMSARCDAVMLLARHGALMAALCRARAAAVTRLRALARRRYAAPRYARDMFYARHHRRYAMIMPRRPTVTV